jgi:serine/threonine protein kinase
MEEQYGIWNDYIKLNMLGSSSYATVYKAKSKKDNKIVATKEYSKFQNNSYKVYLNEIKNMNLLKSPNIINYIDKCETEDNWYIIRNYYCMTLEEFTKIHPKGIPPKQIQKILKDLSNAFKIFNQKEFIHKDIKPSNILLTLNGKNGYKAILSGINLASHYNEEDIYSIREMRYICPPEGLKGESLNMKYDLWSVGILIYFMIMRKYPFDGKRDMYILNQIEKGVNLNISDDTDLNDLLKETLQKDVNQRISWKKFFNHPFLKKEFSEKTTINELKLTKDEKDKLLSYFEKSKMNLLNIVNDYSSIIFKCEKDIANIFDKNIKNELKEAIERK